MKSTSTLEQILPDDPVLLLIDMNGSMTPYHPYSDGVIRAVKQRSLRYGVMYFHNAPHDHLHEFPHLMKPKPIEPFLKEHGVRANIVVISDAGAARGHRTISRLRATARFLAQLKQIVGGGVTWLNPIPAERWSCSSAQIIAEMETVDMKYVNGNDLDWEEPLRETIPCVCPNMQIDNIHHQSALYAINTFRNIYSGEAHMNLARCCAIPSVLSPQLVHQIRRNFLPNTPFVTQSDLLLFNQFCRVSGYEQYVMDAAVRTSLLNEIGSDPDWANLQERIVQWCGN